MVSHGEIGGENITPMVTNMPIKIMAHPLQEPMKEYKLL
jgi:hypothetical protein